MQRRHSTRDLAAAERAGAAEGVGRRPQRQGRSNEARRAKLAQINAYCRTLMRDFHPEKIILFGSYAYGQPTRESDVDLLVIMPHRSGPVRQSVAIRQRCSAPFPLGLLVWTPAYARKRQSWNDSFAREIFQRGRVMYEARHA